MFDQFGQPFQIDTGEAEELPRRAPPQRTGIQVKGVAGWSIPAPDRIPVTLAGDLDYPTSQVRPFAEWKEGWVVDNDSVLQGKMVETHSTRTC